MRSRELRRTLAAMLAVAAAVLMGGCAATHQGYTSVRSGFLSDYSKLREGVGDEPQFVYMNPEFTMHRYEKLILDPIKVMCKPQKSWLAEASDEEVKSLVDYFDAAIRKNLGDDIAFAQTPGPGVLRLRIALTEASSGNVMRDITSSVVPYALALSTVKRVIAGKSTGVGEAAVEMEVVDSVSGECLAAGIDKRIGEKFTGKFDKFDQWRASKAAFDFWAARMKLRLVQAQGKPKPE